MNILLITVGSSGDVYPFIGIGLALRRRSHRIFLAANAHFQRLILSVGLEFIPFGTSAEYDQILDNPDLWNKNRAFATVCQRGIIPLMRPGYEIVSDFHRTHGGVVAAHGIALGARLAQEIHGIPMATIHLAPVVFRSVYQTPKLPGVFLPQRTWPFLKRWVYALADRFLLDKLIDRPVNVLRGELRLMPVRRVIFDWWNSPQLVIGLFPPWYAPPQSDWPPQAFLTDFPLYDAPELQPMPPELCEFLAGGPPPVVLTPGSAMRHAAAIFATVVRTCRATGRRGLLLTHFSDQVPADLPPHVKYFPYAPLSQVLSHSALLVHHGGIGTTAAALAAGVPQVILPFAHDQLDNAARIQRLGVGRAISPARFHPALAGRLFDELTTDSVRDHCEKVAGRLHPHHGLDETCRLIESLAT